MSDLERYGDAWTRHLRLAILRALLDLKGKTGHESLLTDMVGAVHIMADREQVRAEVIWLHKEEMVLADVKHGALCATLTERGINIAEGRSDHPGVKRPNVTAGIGRTLLEISLDSLKR
ncbi:hypothetical protein [Mesorhizobium sp. KR1-2]|uniref:VpaChn25_0724 family phage protein n=1 Tax=Mesorhizobium sp. KR1-2 TaxID=3156609 RepID=UPI0032B480F0